MSKTTVGCRILSWSEQHHSAPEVKVDDVSDASKTTNRLHDLWLLANPSIVDDPVISKNVETAFERMRRVGNIVEASVKDESFYSKLESGFINSVFGNYKAKFDGTEASIKEYLTDLSRQGQGYILQQFERLEIGKKAKVLQVQLDEVFKKADIKGADKATAVLKIMEDAQLPYLIDYTHEINTPTQLLIARRQLANTEYLTKLGLSDKAIKSLHSTAQALVQAQYEVISIGRAVNLDVTKIFESGYLPRVLTPEAQNVLELVVSKEDKKLLDSISTNAGKWLSQSRGSNLLIPNDIETIDDLLNRGGVFKRINSKTDEQIKSILKSRGKTEITSIKDMLGEGDEPFVIDTFLNKLTPDEIDFFTQTGLMSKLPVDSAKMWDELVSHYKLPFDGLDDIFKYDPVEGVKVYTESLSKLAANDAKTWGLIDGAINKFGIPKGTVDLHPNYKSYKPLSEAFPQNVLDQIKDPALLSKLDEVYVHPKVAQIANASYKLQTDPNRLGIVGDVLTFIRKTSAGLMLGTPQLIGRNIMQNIPFLESYGVHPASFLKYVTGKVWDDSTHLIKGSVASFAEALTDKKIWAGGKFSPREMWNFASEKGLINDFSMIGKASKELDLGSFRRTIREMNWMKSTYPEHFNPKYILGKAIKGADQIIDSTLFKYTGYVNTITDNAAKFAMLEQVMNPNRLEKIIGNGAFDVLPYFDDPVKAVAWVKQHSFMFDDIPYDSEAYKIFSSVVPFLSYQMKAFQQTGRYVVEHPHRFASYLQLVGKVNDNFKEDYPLEYSTMVAPFMNQNSPFLPVRIPKELSGTGQDEFFTYSLTGIVSQLGTIENVNMLLDDLGIFESGKLPSNRNDNPFNTGKVTKLRKVFDDLASPPFTTLVAALSGETSYGKDIESMSEAKDRTLLGIQVSQQNYFWYTNLFPSIKSIDKLFSYTGLDADAPEYNPITGEYKVGTRSWTGAKSDYAKAGQLPNVFGMFGSLAELLAINPQHIDVYWKLAGEKRNTLEIQLAAATKEAKSLGYKLANAKDSEDAKRITELYQSHMIYAWYLDTEWAIVNEWAKRHNISSAKAMKNIIQNNSQINELLPKEDIDRIARQNYLKWDNNPSVR
jgi:hypothetical protein